MATIVQVAQPAERHRLRKYVRPTLAKGPVLVKVVAASISGSGDGCWVARAAFGVSDFRWMIFRAWLFEDAPTWLRATYLRDGRSFGAWLGRHDQARAVVRAAMMLAVRRKLSR